MMKVTVRKNRDPLTPTEQDSPWCAFGELPCSHLTFGMAPTWEDALAIANDMADAMTCFQLAHNWGVIPQFTRGNCE